MMTTPLVDGLADDLSLLFFPLHNLEVDLFVQSQPFILATRRQSVEIDVDDRLAFARTIVGLSESCNRVERAQRQGE
jgi:hypothetical protein